MRACLLLVLLAIAACTTAPPSMQHTALPVLVRPSASFDERRPNFVILHYTSNDNGERGLRTLTDPASKVSAHYLVGRDGRIYALVDERARAWHAGVSYWGGNRDVNSAAIGIELDNDGNEPYAAPLIDKLLALLADLKARYSIPTANFLGHSDVAPRRKVDPGARLALRELAARGYGLWCDPPYPVPPAADGLTLLAAFGYDTADAAAATSAFKLHFSPAADSPDLPNADRAKLACPSKKKRARG